MELSADQVQKLEQLAGERGISLLLIFGSTVTGRQHTASDLDIAVLFQKEQGVPGLSEFSELVHELQEIFPGQPVDLGIINHADPLFLKKITENCQILYGTPRTLQELKIYAFRRYQDHRRYFEMERQYVERFLKTPKAAS